MPPPHKPPLRHLDDATTGHVSIADVCAYFGVGRWQVVKWIRGGALPALRIGRSWRVGVPELRAFREQIRYSPPDDPRAS